MSGVLVVVVEHRPSGHSSTKGERGGKKCRIYAFEASSRREREKAKGGGEEKEGCTYTNAIERVTRKEKRRNDKRVFSSELLAVVSLLMRMRCIRSTNTAILFCFIQHAGFVCENSKMKEERKRTLELRAFPVSCSLASYLLCVPSISCVSSAGKTALVVTRL